MKQNNKKTRQTVGFFPMTLGACGIFLVIAASVFSGSVTILLAGLGAMALGTFALHLHY